MKIKKKFIFLLVLFIINVCMFMKHWYFRPLTVIIILILSIYSLFRYKYNKLLFFLFLIIFYFNFSVIVCKYSLFYNSNILNGAFSQIENNESMDIALITLSIFINGVLLFLENKKIVSYKNIDCDIEDSLNKKIIIVSIIVVQCILILKFILSNANYFSQIYEYFLIFLIFGLFLSKNNKTLSKLMTIVILFSCFVTLIRGSRITALEELIALFVINYSDKFNKKSIINLFLIGIVCFTVIGIYGDLKYSKTIGMDSFNIKYICDSIINRKFALDTSVSSYWTGVSMIDNLNHFSVSDRTKNFLQFISSYAILGGKSSYVEPSTQVLKYQVNYGGGFINAYFYFWLGIWGVFLLSAYLGKLIEISFKEDKNFNKLFCVYILSYCPRWYLYTPTMLVRGVLFFLIVYFLIFKIMLRGKNGQHYNSNL